ncbi:hypothetical protein [Plantactinospora sp. B5E13]
MRADRSSVPDVTPRGEFTDDHGRMSQAVIRPIHAGPDPAGEDGAG